MTFVDDAGLLTAVAADLVLVAVVRLTVDALLVLLFELEPETVVVCRALELVLRELDPPLSDVLLPNTLSEPVWYL